MKRSSDSWFVQFYFVVTSIIEAVAAGQFETNDSVEESLLESSASISEAQPDAITKGTNCLPSNSLPYAQCSS